jgi:hypothetical protein
VEVVLFPSDPKQEGLINGQTEEVELLVEANLVEGPKHPVPSMRFEIVWETTWQTKKQHQMWKKR